MSCGKVIFICVVVCSAALDLRGQPTPPTSRPVMKYHDNHSVASDPGGVTLSKERILKLEPALAAAPADASPAERAKYSLDMLTEHLKFGDSRAAVVVSVDPLLVAAYTDELDCVVMLRFPDWLVKEYKLEVGSPLVTVNTYPRQQAPDLVHGPADLKRWGNVFPIIADFVTDDMDRVKARKAEITEDEWKRCAEMASEYRRKFPDRYRDGSPLHSMEPRLEVQQTRPGATTQP